MKVGSLMTVAHMDEEGEEMYVEAVLDAYRRDYSVQVLEIRSSGEVTVFCPALNCKFNVHISDLGDCSLDQAKADIADWKWMVEPRIALDLEVGEQAPELETPKLLSIAERKTVTDNTAPIFEDDDEDE